jgi:hypothetical protein
MQNTSCVLCICNINSDSFQLSTISIKFSSFLLEFLCDLLCVEHGHRQCSITIH